MASPSTYYQLGRTWESQATGEDGSLITFLCATPYRNRYVLAMLGMGASVTSMCIFTGPGRKGLPLLLASLGATV